MEPLNKSGNTKTRKLREKVWIEDEKSSFSKCTMRFLGNRNLHTLYGDFSKLLFVPFIQYSFVLSTVLIIITAVRLFFSSMPCRYRCVSYHLTFRPCKLYVYTPVGIFNFLSRFATRAISSTFFSYFFFFYFILSIGYIYYIRVNKVEKEVGH